MKKLYTVLVISFAGLLLSTFYSCNKDYFEDSGLQKGIFNGTTYEFIKSRPDIFDSLSKIIQLAGMEQEVNAENSTFFAAGDYSVHKTIQSLNKFLYSRGKDTVHRLEQISPAIWKQYLSLYMFKNKYYLNNIPQLDTLNLNRFPGQGFNSINGTAMNLGVLYNDVSASGSGGTQVVKYAGYRQLYISFFRSASETGSQSNMINSPVATSNITTNNGVVHVLNFQKHNFGFDNQRFNSTVYSQGLEN